MDNNQKLKRLRYKLKTRNHNNYKRMSIYISGKHIQIQVIDDVKKHTVVCVSTTMPHVKEYLGTRNAKSYNKSGAECVGELVGKKLHELNIGQVILDRGLHTYTGKVEIIANTVRRYIRI